MVATTKKKLPATTAAKAAAEAEDDGHTAEVSGEEEMKAAVAELAAGMRSAAQAEVEQALAKAASVTNELVREQVWQAAASEHGLVAALVSLLKTAATSKSDKGGGTTMTTTSASAPAAAPMTTAATPAGATTATAAVLSEAATLTALRLLARVAALPGACRTELTRETNAAVIATLVEETAADSESKFRQLLEPALSLLASLVFSSSSVVSLLEAEQCARARGIAGALSSVVARFLSSIAPGASADAEHKDVGGVSPAPSSLALCDASLRLLLFMCRSYTLRLTMAVSPENGGLVTLLVRVVAAAPCAETAAAAAELLTRLTSGPPLLRRAASSALDAASAVTSLLESIVQPRSIAAQESAMLALASVAETGARHVRDALEHDGYAVRVVLGLLEEQERTLAGVENESGDAADGAAGTVAKDRDMDPETAAAATAAAEESEREAIARSTVMATVFGLSEVEEEGDDDNDENGDEGAKPRPVDSARSLTMQLRALRAMRAMMRLKADDGSASALFNDFLAEARPDLPSVLERVAFTGTLIALTPALASPRPAGASGAMSPAPEDGEATGEGAATSDAANIAAAAGEGPTDVEAPSPSPVKDAAHTGAGAETQPPRCSLTDPAVVAGALSVLRMLLAHETTAREESTPLSMRPGGSRSSTPFGDRERQSVTDVLLSPDMIESICSALTSTASEELQCEILDLIADLSMELSLEQRGSLRTNGVLASMQEFAKQNKAPKGLLRAKLASALLCFTADDFIPQERPTEENVKPQLLVPKTAYDWDALGREYDRTMLMLL